jgi:phosphatidylglycerol:prolipoprotein diacylglycerol transferase
MLPEVSLFGWNLPVWHLAYALGAVVAYIIVQKLNGRSNFIQDEDFRWLFVLIYISSFLGARLFAYFVEEESSRPFELIGAMTLYGGMLGSVVIGLPAVFFLRHRVDAQALVLAISIACFAAVAIGRLGCFLNGDDYGIAVDDPQWWSVRFPGHPVDRVPVQLMEMLGCLSIAVFGWKQWQGRLTTLLWMFATYGVLRFLLEYLRGDLRGSIGSSTFSPAQILSLFLISLVCLIAFWKQYLSIKEESSRR